MADTDLELAQLLCTRLCHDLAGPVGAVAAGVELIGGDPSQADAETLGLIGNSSAAASLKLKFMRAALGVAGAGGDTKALLDGYMSAVAGPGGKPALTWPVADAMAAGAAALGAAWQQTVLNLCLLGLEAQPACRALALDVADGGALNVVVEATGDRPAVLRDELAAAISGSAAALTAKNVHGSVAGRLVRSAGGTVALAGLGNGVRVTASFPRKRE
jgi:histidine phosphotransferase ChpT